MHGHIPKVALTIISLIPSNSNSILPPVSKQIHISCYYQKHEQQNPIHQCEELEEEFTMQPPQRKNRKKRSSC